MYAHPPRPPAQPRTAARNGGSRLRRFAGMLAAVTCGLLAPAGIVPAAFAMVVPGGGNAGTGMASVVQYSHPTIVRVIAGGMPGWQITLIALGAAMLAAAATLLLNRVLTARRVTPATTA